MSTIYYSQHSAKRNATVGISQQDEVDQLRTRGIVADIIKQAISGALSEIKDMNSVKVWKSMLLWRRYFKTSEQYHSSNIACPM